MPILKKKTAKTKSKTKPSKNNKPKPRGKLPEKLVKYLESAGLNHQILEHRTVYTAIDAAATMRKKLEEIVKTLLVKADKDYYLVLLPADHNLNFDKLSKVIGKNKKTEVKSIKIPGEKIMAELSNLKEGTLTAFGKLHNLQTVVEKKLEKTKKAVFASGSFNHSIEMAMKDFVKSEQPIVGIFGDKKKIKPAPKPKVKKAPKKGTKKPVKKAIKKKK